MNLSLKSACVRIFDSYFQWRFSINLLNHWREFACFSRRERILANLADSIYLISFAEALGIIKLMLSVALLVRRCIDTVGRVFHPASFLTTSTCKAGGLCLYFVIIKRILMTIGRDWGGEKKERERDGKGAKKKEKEVGKGRWREQQ